jgi:hypothetical protein
MGNRARNAVMGAARNVLALAKDIVIGAIGGIVGRK